MRAVASQPPSLFYLPFRPALDANGIVAPGARLFFFLTQTSIPQKIYADAGLTIELENPVGANAAGVWPSIYMDPALTYRVVLKDQDGVTLNEVDPYRPGVVGEGEQGVPGPADNTYTTLASFKASDVTRKTASLVGVPGISDGRFNWTVGNFTSVPSALIDKVFIKANSQPLSSGAWVKQLPFISVTDLGAKGDGVTDDTAAIQAAFDSAASMVFFPAGQYLHKGLSITAAYQRLYGPGAKLTRTQANTTITVANTARGVHFVEMRFGCQTTGMAGDNITVTAPDFRWMFCESRDCAGRALLIANAGGGANIFGGVMQTAGLGTSAWDFELRDDPGGADTLYCAIFGVITNQGSDHTGATPVGGFLITGEVGTTTIECCQFGKLRMDNGGSSRVSHSRINSDATILSGFATFVACNLNGATVFGQTGQPNIGSICFDSTNVMANYGSLTINGNVIQSSFHLGQVVSAGTPVTIHPAAYNNDIWHPAMDVSSQIDLGAESGTPTKGNATVTAWMSAAGRDRTLRLSFQAGSTTNFGGGNYFTVSAPFISKGIATAPVRVTSNAQLLDWTAYLRNGTNQIKFTPSSGPGGTVGNDASATSPLTLGAGTLIEMSMTVEQTF